jgi:cysteine/O-acetylserine efflux protein
VQQAPLFAAFTFALAGTFSPGPNNVMSGSLGIMYGFRRCMPFILGVTCGFTLVMALCAAAATVLLGSFPAVEPVLKYAGSAYILWLAWATWSKRANFGKAVGENVPRSHGFLGGLVLQFVNPKAFIYGLIMYSTFLSGLSSSLPALTVSAVVLGALGFVATSTWALAGMTIRHWLRTDTDRAIVAGVLSMTLIYTAAELLGLPALIGSLAR